MESKNRLIPQFRVFSSDSIADGEYIFDLKDSYLPRMTNIVEYFYFINANKDIVSATVGNVTIHGSPDGGKIYQNFNDNEFLALDALSQARTKPSGIGRCTHVKVTVSGIVATGATGFTLGFTRI